MCLAAALAVILIIWGIRVTHKDSGSSGPNLPPPSTTTTQAASSQSAQTSFVAPIDSAQLTQYEQYATGFQTANEAATKGFNGGSAPTTAQLAPVVGAYRTAVNLYDFQLHFIQWPASMQPAVQADHAQLAALLGLLSVVLHDQRHGYRAPGSPTCTTRPATAQTADNVIRKDVGLPSSSSFP